MVVKLIVYFGCWYCYAGMHRPAMDVTHGVHVDAFFFFRTVTLSSNVPSSSRSQGSIDQSEDIQVKILLLICVWCYSHCSVQQLLGSLMTNEELPWRLAELINQHVGERYVVFFLPCYLLMSVNFIYQ